MSIEACTLWTGVGHSTLSARVVGLQPTLHDGTKFDSRNRMGGSYALKEAFCTHHFGRGEVRDAAGPAESRVSLGRLHIWQASGFDRLMRPFLRTRNVGFSAFLSTGLPHGQRGGYA